MNNIYLLYNFNNYFNRQVKRFSTLAEYKTAVNNNFISVPNVINFTPNDGVDTKQIFNVTALNVAAGTPDYMLVVDDNDVIESRWFVIDTERTRAQQYIFHLYRDTIAEAWEQLQNAPVFVEKGILSQSDPMIFNPENMTYNQIKKRELLIQDFSAVPWIVGYMPISSVTTENQTFIPDIVYDASYASLSDYPYYDYRSTAFNTILQGNIFYLKVNRSGSEPAWQFYFNEQGIGNVNITESHSGYIESEPSKISAFKNGLKNNCSVITDQLKTTYSIATAAAAQTFMSEENKILYISSEQKFYKVVFTRVVTEYRDVAVSPGGTIGGKFTTVVNTANTVEYLEGFPVSDSYKYDCQIIGYTIRFAEVPNEQQVNYKISNSRSRLTDQPYSMFCMPAGKLQIIGFDGYGYADWKNISLAVAKDICAKYNGDSADFLYDLQLLPYCPVPEFKYPYASQMTLTGLTENTDFNYITQNNVNVGIIFWATRSSGSINIGVNDRYLTVDDNKLDSETKMVRLCSPNFAGNFDFNNAKNGGVTKFNVDYMYKPYSPYIHVNPDFGGLYGVDFNDARGLICGGKFDMPQTTDAWASYERSNSNYNNIFNRQIENLEITQQTQRIGEITGMISGAIGAGITGGMSGGAAGAIGAFGLSAAAGIADIALSERLRSETMDYTKDMYGYQLGNIKALPEGLTSVGSQTPNNKLFPFIEIYDCTENEKNALIEKIRYNGMSVGRIGTLGEFASNTWTYSNGWNYFKGKLIRLELDGEDWHFVNTIKSELDRGIFIKEA